MTGLPPQQYTAMQLNKTALYCCSSDVGQCPRCESVSSLTRCSPPTNATSPLPPTVRATTPTNQPKKFRIRLEARGDDTNRHFFILINRSSYFFFFPQVVSPDTTESNCHIGCQCPSWPMTLDTLNWHHWCCYWGVVRNLCVYLTALTIFSLHLDFLLVTGKASLRPL